MLKLLQLLLLLVCPFRLFAFGLFDFYYFGCLCFGSVWLALQLPRVIYVHVCIFIILYAF